MGAARRWRGVGVNRLGPRLQERDGYKEQLGALRDKVSQFARELAEAEDEARGQGERLAAAAADLAAEQEARRAAERAWRNEKILIVQVCRPAPPRRPNAKATVPPYS